MSPVAPKTSEKPSTNDDTDNNSDVAAKSSKGSTKNDTDKMEGKSNLGINHTRNTNDFYTRRMAKMAKIKGPLSQHDRMLNTVSRILRHDSIFWVPRRELEKELRLQNLCEDVEEINLKPYIPEPEFEEVKEEEEEDVSSLEAQEKDYFMLDDSFQIVTEDQFRKSS